MIGQTISHYKVLEQLGEGGMGVVYKAEDTKLERTVALKFLASHLLDNDEAKERFLREAKAAASLHHPNICPVYEIDEADGKTFLAMAFLKGATLEERIGEGPLPLKDVLEFGRQVADGLQAAHAEGIVHRDIKPANILVSPERRATIMDFGLARLTEASRLTKLETTMGTAAYMSPEQLQGMELDHRSDVWSLGVVLYEMVAGVRPFKGQYDQALLYEIVNQDPEPLTGVRTGLPMDLEFIVGKCLAKDPGVRYQNTSEVGVDLRSLADKLKSGRSSILRTGAASSVLAATSAPNKTDALPPGTVILRGRRLRVERILTAALGLALLGVLVFYFAETRQEPAEKPVTRFSFAPENLRDVRVSHEVTISPNGKHILYAVETDGKSSLWVRPLNSEAARELPGTQGAEEGFWSPDSSSIGFATDSELKRVSMDGGEPIALCKLAETGELGFVGGTWSSDLERIVYSSGLRLYEVATRGGQPRLLFDPKGAPRAASLYPHFLPAGGGPPAIVYSASTGPTDRWVAVLNLETGERRELGPGSGPVYFDGHLVYGTADDAGEGLWAWPFSLETLEPIGEAFPVSATGKAPTLSLDGTLVYMEGDTNASIRTLLWLNRSGEGPEAVGQPQPLLIRPALSPDGSRVAVRSIEGGIYSIWIHDLVRSTKARLTLNDVTSSSPAWSPTGLEIAYQSNDRDGSRGIRRQGVNGTGESILLAQTGASRPDWSQDGRRLVYQDVSDIFYLDIPSASSTTEPKTFLATAASERMPTLSPDSQFLAYVSNESGRDEIYLSAFPAENEKLLCSTSGGTEPRWRRDGKELYYVEGSTLMAVPVSTTGESVTLGRPKKLFDFPNLTSPNFGYDVSEDGQRFLLVATDETAVPEQTVIRVVQNWSEEFRDRE